MLDIAPHGLDVCLWLTETIGGIRNLHDIYDAALEALARGLGVQRSSILLFDDDGVMRFKAWRGLSSEYRALVEGHTPWRPDTPHATPIIVPDVEEDAALAAYRPHFARERIRALTFIPLTSGGRVIGKFMLYYGLPYAPTGDDLRLAGVISAQVAFAVERRRAQERAEQSEERLRFAVNAAQMGTWEWDLGDVVRWSDNLERIHGMRTGSFDGQLSTFAREIHPDDRDRVLTAARRAISDGTPYEVEYRIVTRSGEVRWLEGKGRVEYDANARPVRMSGICMNVTGRKQAEADRLHAAQEANRTKDEFLAVLSHELRTPLNAILGWAQLLEGGTLDPGRRSQAVAVIARNARLQAQLIEQILDVSRIITGKLKIERSRCHPASLVEIAVKAVEPAAVDKHIKLRTEIDPGLPELDGDPTRLQQVLGNVLSNALKFTPAGGQIAVRCRRDGDRVIIEVADTGSGIAPEFLPFIFERFRQADGTPTRQHGGLGLGLAIARHLVELHGGKLRATSEGPGRGTTLQISLPAAGSESRAALGVGAPPAVSKSSLHGARILIVDDEEDARHLLTAILSPHGAIVHEAASAQAAIEALGSTEIDLIIADIGMPDVDGYELIRRIRSGSRHVAAIAVTAYARPEDRTRALEAGYDVYVAKPFDTDAFVRISAALRMDRRAARSTTASRP